MFPSPAAIAEATAPNSSGPIFIPITVTADIGRLGVGSVVHHFEVDMETLLPSVEEELTDRRPARRPLRSAHSG